MKYLLIVVATALSQFSYAGSVYKCESSNGIVYQSSPCAAGAKKLAATCTSGYSSNNGMKFTGEDCETKARKLADEKEAKQKIATAKADANQRAWEASPYPSIGMSSSQVESSRWGSPDKVNTTVTAGGTSEQWVYRDFGYVYLQNGVVTTIQKNN